MQAMTLGGQQVVVDRLPHQVVPEPQPTGGGALAEGSRATD